MGTILRFTRRRRRARLHIGQHWLLRDTTQWWRVANIERVNDQEDDQLTCGERTRQRIHLRCTADTSATRCISERTLRTNFIAADQYLRLWRETDREWQRMSDLLRHAEGE